MHRECLIKSLEMKLTISSNKKIYALQEEFNSVFPYLKIDFFNIMQKGEGFEKKQIKHSSKTLAECSLLTKKSKIIIDSSMTVNDVEKMFMDVYGISIQICRKSGKVWLETTVTDSWTLEEQNKQGEELSRKLN